MVVAAEATWVSMLMASAVNAAPGTHVHLPFLALALPAAVAAAWCATLAGLTWRWWWKVGAVGLGVALGVALTAGLTGELTRSGSWWQTATRPWTAAGHPAAVVAGVAWFAAGLAWGRGVWLGLAAPSFRHVTWSLALGGVAFVGIFAGQADHHAIAFLASTRAAGWLFFVFFPLTAAAAALVRERELEESLLARSATPPSLVWVSVLAVPLVGVGLVALLLAVVVGPGAPIAGRAVGRAAAAVWGAITAAAGWLWHLLPTSRPGSTSPPVAHSQSGPPPGVPHVRPVHAPFNLPAVVWEILVVLAVVVVAYYSIRSLSPRMKWRPLSSGESAEEERSSIFSWRHLWAQLRSGLRWPWRRGPTPEGASALAAGPLEDEAGMATVRLAYRRFLSTARTVGRGRARSETARELEARLRADLAPAPADALKELTYLYDDVRYGAVRTDAATNLLARNQSTAVCAALAELSVGTAADPKGHLA